MLQACGVRRLVDVRTVPRSRRNPQYDRATLPASLAAHGIEYAAMPDLGGLRRPHKDSSNTAWRNEAFRGYADHMATPIFENALGELLAAAARIPTAVMCAEAVPWRCHRSLLADAASARGARVLHIMGTARSPKQSRHELTAWAVVRDGRVGYPGLPLDGADR